MPRMVKCKVCGKQVSSDEAFKMRDGQRNAYYCSIGHMKAAEAEKRKSLIKKTTQDKVYKKISDIIGQEYSWPLVKRKMESYMDMQGLKKMLSYMDENESYLADIMNRKSFDNGYNKIAYFCAILMNNLPDFSFREMLEVERKVDISDMPSRQKKTAKRRTIGEMEEDLV